MLNRLMRWAFEASPQTAQQASPQTAAPTARDDFARGSQPAGRPAAQPACEAPKPAAPHGQSARASVQPHIAKAYTELQTQRAKKLQLLESMTMCVQLTGVGSATRMLGYSRQLRNALAREAVLNAHLALSLTARARQERAHAPLRTPLLLPTSLKSPKMLTPDAHAAPQPSKPSPGSLEQLQALHRDLVLADSHARNLPCGLMRSLAVARLLHILASKELYACGGAALPVQAFNRFQAACQAEQDQTGELVEMLEERAATFTEHERAHSAWAKAERSSAPGMAAAAADRQSGVAARPLPKHPERHGLRVRWRDEAEAGALSESQ